MARRRRRSLKEDLKDIFAMHRGERRAFMALLSLCVIGAVWVTWEQWLRPREIPEKDRLEVAWWAQRDTTKNGRYNAKAIAKDLHLFNFDPNGLPVEQWTELGLSEKQAATIHRYEERGGKFRTKADLAKMRVVDPELYEQWEPFIQLPETRPRREWKNEARKDRYPRDTGRWERKGAERYAAKRNIVKVELNGADSAALVAIYGIGPSFARGILRFRDRLGGYASLDQISEVYILRDKPDVVERIREKLTLDPLLLKRIHLNSCTVEDLGPHPYCGWKLAKALIAYRNHHGPYANVAAISNCVLVTDSIRERLSPYLTVEP